MHIFQIILDFIHQCFIGLLSLIKQYSVIFTAVTVSITLALLRSLQQKSKMDWVEAVICGTLTIAVSSALKYFNMPEELAIFFGGIIGFKGSKWFDKFITNHSQKIKKEDKND